MMSIGQLNMSFIAKWESNEENVVLCLGRGEWTWDGFIELLQCVYDMIRAAEHTVDIIVPGMSEVEYPTTNLVAELRNPTCTIINIDSRIRC